MAKGFKHGAGGGAALNFKVVGNPKPTVPAENTIWVDTDVPITAWEFSSKTPTEPVEGMVWFQSGAASAAQFNALKKNNITVCPNGSSQYIDGAWASKEAHIALNGKWVSWELVLYDKGEFDDIAGTMTQVPVKQYAGASGNVPGIAGSCSIATNSESVTIISMGNESAIAHFSKKVDLTPYKTLVFNGGIVDNGGRGCQFGIWTDFGAVYTDGCVAYLNGAVPNGDHALDVSKLSGEHYIGWWLCGTSNSIKITVNKVHLR